MSSANYDRYSALARGIVAEGNELLSTHCYIRTDSYDPKNFLSTSDHAQGYAYDINAASPAELVYLYLYICVYFEELQKKYGLKKAFLSAHNRHIHISFNPSASPLLGLETISGDGRTAGKLDPAKFPIVHISGWEDFLDEIHKRPSLVQLYGVNTVDVRSLAHRLAGADKETAGFTFFVFLTVLGIIIASQGGDNNG